MSTPPPPRKKKRTAPLKPQTGPLPAGKKRPKGKRRAPKKKSYAPQIMAGAMVLAVLGGVVATVVYLTDRITPKVQPVEAGTPAPLARPSIAPAIKPGQPKRPGLTAAMPDEGYYPKASDIPAGSPLEQPVQGLLSRGVLTVFLDGKFRPEAPVSRAQFLSWCYNAVMAQSESNGDPFAPVKKPFIPVSPTGGEFGDVPAEHWAAGVLATVKGSGLLGTSVTNFFRPDAALTREEWLVLASHFAGSLEQKAALARPLDEAKLKVAYRKLNYTDYEALKPAFRPYAWFVFGDEKRKAWVAEAFTPPTNPGPWRPGAAVTRGEAAAWIGGAWEAIGTGAF